MGDLTLFSKRLKEARLKADLTQAQLAKMADTTPATVSAYENTGTIKKASLDLVINLAKALSVSVDWLCGLNDNSTIQNSENDESKFTAIKTFINLIGSNSVAYSMNESYMTLEVNDIGLAYYIQEYKRICEVIENMKDGDLREKAKILFSKDFDKSFTEKMYFDNNLLKSKDKEDGVYSTEFRQDKVTLTIEPYMDYDQIPF